MDRVLVFVEDPGAAAYIASVPDLLRARGAEVTVMATGPARDVLTNADTPFTDVSTARGHLWEPAPDIVVVGTAENPDTIGLRLIEDARRALIPTVGFVDAPSNAAARFRGRTDRALAFCPDRLLVPDRLTRTRFEELGLPSARIAVCGHPRHDDVRAHARRRAGQRGELRARLWPDVGVDTRLVLFAAELSDGLDPQEYRRSAAYTLAGRGESDGRTEIVLEELIDAMAPWRDRSHLVLRLHPKHPEDALRTYRHEVDAISRGGSALDILLTADLVVGMSSLLLVEALLTGVPVLSVLPRDRECEWLSAVAAGAVPTVNRRQGLRDRLDQFFRNRWVGASDDAVAACCPEGAAVRVAEEVLTTARRRH
ncbi:MAG: hypothetical protein AB7I25_01365 [Vicinamibacterales bacterium]